MTEPGRQKIARLKVERPDIAIEVIRTSDLYTSWDGDGEIDRNVYSCYDHEVRVTTVRNGELVTASAYLGGSWYDVDDMNEQNQESLAEVSGYLPDLIDEALEELDGPQADDEQPTRTKGDDDGQEYGDPRDYRDGKE